MRDENGAIFIDRDPNLFGLILNFLRTRDIDLNDVNIRALRHECDYFGITPLSRRLALCDEMNHSSCGDVLFYGYLPPPCKYLIIYIFVRGSIFKGFTHGSKLTCLITTRVQLFYTLNTQISLQLCQINY